MKVYQVCDTSTGYCCSFKVATGQSSTTHGLVLGLTKDYLGRGHKIYMDQYYSSISLFQELYAKQTVAVGTCMANQKGLPKDLVKQRLPRGGGVSCTDGALLALKWRDKHDVLVLSTKHTPAMEDVSVRAPGGHIIRHKPISVLAYNHYMAGVDKSDQLLSYYSFSRQTTKWWKKLSSIYGV